jgi:2-keto-4-pentenoate hydratase/2-oxohepta-3-ene-1,7-dioic acid hydratase in catechol pathway
MSRAAVRHLARYRLSESIHFGFRDGGEYARLSRAPWDGGVDTGVRDPADRVALLAPVTPSKVICVGLNYREHIAESVSVVQGARVMDEPLLFLKPPSALLPTGDAIRYPAGVTRLDPEAELAVVIGRRARAVSESESLDCVAGLTCFNDVSARNYQKQDSQWTRAKGFDTFAPVGPWIAVGLEPGHLGVECRVNGHRRQSGNTADLIFPVAALIRFISRIMTLEPGDLIATGTPAGVAPIVAGDRVEVEVEGIGVLENHVEAAPAC